ncbi:MAG TPA: hypothetical protein VLU46_12565 [Thermoanaerobaculia bacterium]|nr:hypothetical protein [Thermoanaerobaculia bacterium]
MRVRTILWLTAIVSMIIGAFVVYLVLTVPNDLKADAMLKTAHKELAAGKRDTARAQLSKIVQEYPRTDAAAAATVALVTLGDQERRELQAEVARLHTENATHNETLSTLQHTVETIKNAPPKEVIVRAPPKKPAPHKKTTHRRRRRRR